VPSKKTDSREHAIEGTSGGHRSRGKRGGSYPKRGDSPRGRKERARLDLGEVFMCPR